MTLRWRVLAVITAGAALVLASTAEAGRGGGGGGGRGGYAGGGYRGAGGSYAAGGYHAGGYYAAGTVHSGGTYAAGAVGGRYAYGSVYAGRGFGPYGYRGYYPYGFYGFGLGFGLGYAYGAGWYYPYSMYAAGWNPYAGGAAPTSAAYYSPDAAVAPETAGEETPASPPRDGAAHLLLRVPVDAEVWFDGNKTQQTGVDREFVSPKLEQGKTYTYEVVARWKEGDRPVEQKRKLRVFANMWAAVDLTEAEPVAMPKAP
jgi:uncharacterized protein (TIGR03000 family)